MDAGPRTGRAVRRTAVVGFAAAALLFCAATPSPGAAADRRPPDRDQVAAGLLLDRVAGPVTLAPVGDGSTVATHVSDDGRYIVGVRSLPNGDRHVVLWHDGRGQDLGFDGRPLGVNNQGRVFGSAHYGDHPHGFSWYRGRLTPLLGHRAEYGDEFVRAMNNVGTIAGSVIDDDDRNDAVTWVGGQFAILNDGLSEFADAYDINDAGVVVGRRLDYDWNFDLRIWQGRRTTSVAPPRGWEAIVGLHLTEKGVVGGEVHKDIDDYEKHRVGWFRYFRGRTTVLATDGPAPELIGMSDTGRLLGVLRDESGRGHGYTWAGRGPVRVLAEKSGWSTSPSALNNHADVGTSSPPGTAGRPDQPSLGVAWNGSRRYVLPRRGSGSTTALDISKTGVIVGSAEDRHGVAHAVMWLTPWAD